MSLFFLLYFALKTFDTQLQFNRFMVYALLVGLCATGLNSIMIRFGEPKEEGGVPDWDENFKLVNLVWIFGGIAGIVLVSSFILSSGRLFYFVSWQELQSLGQMAVVPVASANWALTVFQEAVWQVFVVAYSEECLKLAVILVFVRALKDYAPLDQIVGAGFPILLWAQFHSMLAYGQNTMMILAAFLAGVILYVSLVLTGSILVPIIIHGMYNLIVVLPGMGVNILPILPQASTLIMSLMSTAVTYLSSFMPYFLYVLKVFGV